MASYTFTQWAEIYARRIVQCKDGTARLLEMEKIWRDIQKLTSDGVPLTDEQKARMLDELKQALKKLGYDDSVLALEYRKGTEVYEELAKSASISNEELLSMMKMVAKGPGPKP
ncbi:hypothetical protein D8682_00360 (plasmid) [Buttiauxella sp. 3AFRM03]|uniref:hypothetical protein n=1 Tax=Buttiauxella sp. 3AFRM03 TaxID=2479367 RepID=UPI000EF7BAB6|nr:hypothetical protein [Buttiauxella sp. 3AFRM03]AYN25566.1 hypothetical protein D8682_00360 [Buttiauxella sp. 3AFRM03]